jgi:hypothetical protein
VTTFSAAYRLQMLVDLAEQFERRVVFIGRGMQRSFEIAQRLANVCVRLVSRCGTSGGSRCRRTCCVCAGSQEPPFASRLLHDHRHVGSRLVTWSCPRRATSLARKSHRPGDEPPRPGQKPSPRAAHPRSGKAVKRAETVDSPRDQSDSRYMVSTGS